MISGISGNNSSYGYQSILNQHRLEQVMQKRNSSLSLIKPVSSLPSVSSSETSSSDSLSYLKKYSSSMSDLMSSSNSLCGGNSGSVTNQLSVASSDSQVMEASSRYKQSTPTTYEIQVDQLASAQINVSDAVSSQAKATEDVSMQITTSTGAIDINVSAVDEKGTQKTNAKLLADTAKAINDADTGVKASVITKDGKSSIQVQSQKTGTSNEFLVSGDFADKSGISQAAQKAQNASYTVKDSKGTKSYTSESNKVSLGYGNIDVSLKKEGSATLTVGVDPAKTVEAMEDFVKSYNNTVTLLSQNTDRGGGTYKQLQKLESYVPGSKTSLDRMGLSVEKDGTLSLDKSKLTKNLTKEPNLTQDLISGSSGLAQRAFSSAQSGMGASASSLIKNDIAEAEYNTLTDPINFMNTYSRTGAHNMMNYYASGMMFSAYG